MYNYVIPYCDNLTEGHIHVVDLTNKKSGDCFVQGCAIHVNGSSYRNYKAAHPLVDSIFHLQATQCYWHGSRTESNFCKLILKILMLINIKHALKSVLNFNKEHLLNPFITIGTIKLIFTTQLMAFIQQMA